MSYICNCVNDVKLLFQMQGQPPKYISMLQAFKLIHKEDGWRGYFRGNLSNVIRITPTSAFQFFFYDLYKKLFFGNKTDLNPFERLSACFANNGTITGQQ